MAHAFRHDLYHIIKLFWCANAYVREKYGRQPL